MSKLKWSRLFLYLRPYLGWQLLGLVCMVGGVAASLVFPFAIQALIDKVLGDKRIELLTVVVSVMLGAALLQVGLGVARDYLFALVGQRILYDLRKEMIVHLHRLPVAHLAKSRTGELMSRLLNDVEALTYIASGAVVTLLTELLTIAAVTAALLFLDWKLAVMSLGAIPVFWLIFTYFNKNIRDRARVIRSAQSGSQPGTFFYPAGGAERQSGGGAGL